MHKRKDYLELQNMSNKNKRQLISLNEVKRRDVLICEFEKSYLIKNEYPHIEYKYCFVLWPKNKVFDYKEYVRIKRKFYLIFGEKKVKIRISTGDSVKWNHIHFFVRYPWIIEKAIKLFYGIYFKIRLLLYKIKNACKRCKKMKKEKN